MTNLATSHSTPSPAPTHAGVFPIEDLLADFARQHGRTLSPRARRTLDELTECLTEYLGEHNVSLVAKVGRTGVVSLSGLLGWLDAFERDEMFDALDGEREKLRVADGAIRAMTRHLSKALS